MLCGDQSFGRRGLEILVVLEAVAKEGLEHVPVIPLSEETDECEQQLSGKSHVPQQPQHSHFTHSTRQRQLQIQTGRGRGRGNQNQNRLAQPEQ
jgi:hypothetical protein